GRQLSAGVHVLASVHAVPVGAAGLQHVPVTGLQVPARWHWSSAVQRTGVPAHTPAWHVSPVVQAVPSVQIVPLATTGLEQAPVAGSQVPARWHWSDAGHVTAVPAQTPAWHVSPVVHALPSLQAVPLA